MRILEVGPRDGLQNEKKTLSLSHREDFIKRLLELGLSDIEVGSFVKKEAIPQLEGTTELIKKLLPWKNKKFPAAKLWAFVPNERGLEEALKTKIDGIALYSATSESFLKKNINRSFEENKKALKTLFKMLRGQERSSRVYLSTLVYCPFEGVIHPKTAIAWIEFLLDIGYNEIALSDTTGHAYPENLKPIFKWIDKNSSLKKFALHFHDTRGTALLNTQYAIDFGFKKFDSSLGGAGGCPYAPGASGNLATEDLLYLMHSQGKFKNISLKKVAAVSMILEEDLERELPSKVLQSIKAQKELCV